MKKTTEKFREWIEKKIEVEFTQNDKNLPDVWEFWRYYEGMNVGNEISKDWKHMRACLILKTNTWNELVLICPLTSARTKWRYFVEINQESWLPKASCGVINQIKFIDKKRLAGLILATKKLPKTSDYIKKYFAEIIL